ncbi:hypothetical protein AB5I83_08460 [Mesobacillus sp. LC4]
MIDFQKAYHYLENTSSNDIFTRIVPYYVYSSIINKPINRFALLVVLASLKGPFKPDVFKEPEVEDFLELGKYQMEADWYLYVDQWAERYVHNSTDTTYYHKMWDVIMQKDQSISQLMMNHDFKHREYYIPELRAFGFMDDHWPRK